MLLALVCLCTSIGVGWGTGRKTLAAPCKYVLWGQFPSLFPNERWRQPPFLHLKALLTKPVQVRITHPQSSSTSCSARFQIGAAVTWVERFNKQPCLKPSSRQCFLGVDALALIWAFCCLIGFCLGNLLVVLSCHAVRQPPGWSFIFRSQSEASMLLLLHVNVASLLWFKCGGKFMIWNTCHLGAWHDGWFLHLGGWESSGLASVGKNLVLVLQHYKNKSQERIWAGKTNCQQLSLHF